MALLEIGKNFGTRAGTEADQPVQPALAGNKRKGQAVESATGRIGADVGARKASPGASKPAAMTSAAGRLAGMMLGSASSGAAASSSALRFPADLDAPLPSATFFGAIGVAQGKQWDSDSVERPEPGNLASELRDLNLGT